MYEMMLIYLTVIWGAKNEIPVGFNFSFLSLEKLESLVLFAVHGEANQYGFWSMNWCNHIGRPIAYKSASLPPGIYLQNLLYTCTRREWIKYTVVIL